MSYSKKTAKQLQATKQKDIEIVLSQENLDLYQLEVCLNIDENITTNFLAEHTDAQECVKKLFEDPNTYLVQKRLRDNGSLQKVFDVNTQFAQTEEKLKKLPGEEIFRIFTTKEDDIAGFNQAQVLKTVLRAYYDQTAELSDIHASDLCYTVYKNSDRWTGRLNQLLNVVGQFKENPEIEKLIEEKIGTIFAHGTFDEIKTDFMYMSSAGIEVFEEKMLQEVVKNPYSVQSKFYMEYAEDVLSQWRRNCGRGTQIYENTMCTLTEKLIKEHTDVALTILDKVKDKCDVSYLAKLYDIEKSESLLPMMADALKKELNEDGTLPLKTKLMVYEYAQKTGNKELQAAAVLPIEKNITITSELLNLFKENVDYGPFFEELRQSDIQTICLSFNEDEAKNVDMKVLNELISAHLSLQSISMDEDPYRGHSPEIDGEVLATNPKLKKISVSSVKNAAKLLNTLSDLEELEMSEETEKNPALYEVLTASKPEKLERLTCKMSREEAEALMNKYKDLLINENEYGYTDTQQRNMAIIRAKKNKKIEDLQFVICVRGIVEYLETIEPKDRPTFDVLRKEEESALAHKSCFDVMREVYGNKYFETLAQVAALCDIKELQREAELLTAVKDKNIIEYLQALKPEERPKFSDFLKKTIATKEGGTLIKEIKKSYPAEKLNDVVIGVLELTKATNEDLKVLENDADMSEIVQKYAKRMQYNQSADASKAAFEKWKKEHQKEK